MTGQAKEGHFKARSINGRTKLKKLKIEEQMKFSKFDKNVKIQLKENNK